MKKDTKAEKSYDREPNPVTVSAVIFAFWTALSRILGFLRDAMTAIYFTAEVRDAFFVAFRLPNLFRRVFGEGSLSAGFIPAFVKLLVLGKDKEARGLGSGVFSLLLVVSMTFSLLGIVYMEQILGLLLSGNAYMSVPGKFHTTVQLARIMFGFLVLVSLYAFFMAILHSLNRFALAALGPCLFNICMIASAYWGQRYAAPEKILAWSVLVGGFAQMIILVPSVIRAGFFPAFHLRWFKPQLVKVVLAMLPSLTGAAILQLTPVVNLHFASHLPQGTHTYFYLADRILELPLALFVISIGSALLPTLSRYFAEGNQEALGAAINRYLRLILFCSLPAAAGVFMLAQPITEVLFLRGEFKFSDAVATAQVMQVYSLTIVIAAGVRILSQGFFAIRNTWFPAIAAGVGLISHIIFAYSLTRTFGILGLASATVVSGLVNLGMLAVAYNSWVGKLDFRTLGQRVVKYLAGIVVMSIPLFFFDAIVVRIGGRYSPKWLVLFLMIALGIAIYAGIARFLQVEEYDEVRALLRKRKEGLKS